MVQIERGEAAGLDYLDVSFAEVGPAAPLVIGLHGRGSSPDDLAGLAPLLDTGWRYVFPRAPLRLDFGVYGTGYSWYEPIPATPEQMTAARALLAAFLAALHERLMIPPGRSALLGFSQGAAMTLAAGLRAPTPYAALVALSGYLPEAADLPTVIAARTGQPVLIAHGTHDDVLDITLARRARATLEAHGLTPEYHEFALRHEIGDEELAAVRDFLHRHLRTEDATSA
ncbi:MAG: alpha/beta hydrolase [Thermomicrobiales bacterium]